MDLTGNQVASGHVRHMIGGRGNGGEQELAFSIEVPEYAGSLLHLLNEILTWNISMSHYHNHGAAKSLVFLGLHATDKDKPQMLALLDCLGYYYTKETDNPVYRYFLR